MYVFDTNVYLGAAESESFAERAAEFVEQADEAFAVSSVVVAELLVGLADQRDRAALLTRVYATVSSQLVLTPIHEDWERAADGLRRLGGSAVAPRRSFWNDLLLAASCARTGYALITSNRADFRRVAREIPVEIVEPWP